MIISKADKSAIKESIRSLNNILDSDAYMEMVNNLETPPDVRKKLNQLWDQRNDLVLDLIDILADEIEQNDPKFQELLKELKNVNKIAKEAADGLKKIADRIESAVKLAKALDKVISFAGKSLL
jgi:methyl-accepting chemotaxis protein